MLKATLTVEQVMAELKALSNPDNVKGMARFGINHHNTLGVSVPYMRKLAAGTRKDHSLALKLWQTGIHEARIIASMVDDPTLVTEDQMERWVSDFDSWDVCDQVCMNLFSRTPPGIIKAHEWTSRQEEFVKRAGFALMASLAHGNKGISDEQLAAFLPDIERESADGRNFVRKAVNWALRQIGKKNRRLNTLAVAAAERIRQQENKSARWIATDALRELTDEKTRSRLKA